jgi:hypothetical protein
MPKFHALTPRGEAHFNAKLTPEKVREIRQRTANRVRFGNDPLKAVAFDFGVSVQCVSHIIKGRRWAHVK